IVNNTTIINVNSLDNYNVPGGVSLMESRRFDNGRVVVNQGELKSPSALPRDATGGDRSTPRVVQEFKPVQAAPARELKYERAELARRVEAPVIQRRQAPDADRSSSPARPAGDAVGARPTREGQVSPERSAPSRSLENASPTRIQDGQIIRNDRPSRSTEYQSVERTPAPNREERRAPERSNPTRTTQDAGDSSRPTPSRTEAPRRYDPPTRNEAPSRTEAPRRYDPPTRNEAPSRTEAPRRYDPPPVRESQPSRSERPSPPPRESAPAREGAPQRTERPAERPSSPPARESAPSRPESRPERPSNPTREKP
ncbi:MAG TPA: hypothetical protein PLQ88_22790, partial [Blastocatellia bacterium]|nr:hypothetical protein [Blastocatellia bacterium]